MGANTGIILYLNLTIFRFSVSGHDTFSNDSFTWFFATINIFRAAANEKVSSVQGFECRLIASTPGRDLARSRTLNKTRNRELPAYRVPLRFFRRNLCPIMNLRSVDSAGSGVNADACVWCKNADPRGTHWAHPRTRCSRARSIHHGIRGAHVDLLFPKRS